jgi:hypothetical protein
MNKPGRSRLGDWMAATDLASLNLEHFAILDSSPLVLRLKMRKLWGGWG